MIEVEITNYQSIAYAKFEIEGFTTIVGRNSLGKSAALRAINAALTNQQGTDFIRWGTTFCDVKLKIGDLKIHWHKEEGNNFYRINDDTLYSKIGKDEPPKEISDAGFKLIKLGDQKINLNYADQFNPLFLVDKLDSKGADLLTSVYGLDRLYKAVDLCNKAQRENTDELRMREKDLSIATKDLERFEHFDEVKALTETLKARKSQLDSDEVEVQKLREKYAKIQELIAICKRLQKVKEVKFPESADIRENVLEYKKLLQFLDVYNKLSSALKKLKGVHEVVVPTDISSSITKEIVEYKKLCAWKTRHDALTRDIQRLSKLDSVILPKAEIDGDELRKLRSFQVDADKQKRELLAAKRDLDAAIAEHDRLIEEKKKFKICPLCNGALN